jgi:ABC-type phosphate transport system substrate-binding protein
MMRAGNLAPLAFLVAVVLGLATRSIAAESDSFKIVVHPDNPITSVERAFLRKAYLKKALEWPGGEGIRPVDLSTKFPVRERFTHDVLKKTPAQLKNYWNQQIFSGKAVPPHEVGSTADLIEYVIASPGAVGYLPAGADPGEAKVIEVK